jgi:hypothetical protein
MKRMIAMALLTLAVAAGSQQRASAWSKFNFGVGMNLCCESGGTSTTRSSYRSSSSGPAPWGGQGYGEAPGGHHASNYHAFTTADMAAAPAPKASAVTPASYSDYTPAPNYGYYPANYGYYYGY